jgi:hypothetical protein
MEIIYSPSVYEVTDEEVHQGTQIRSVFDLDCVNHQIPIVVFNHEPRFYIFITQSRPSWVHLSNGSEVTVGGNPIKVEIVIIVISRQLKVGP